MLAQMSAPYKSCASVLPMTFSWKRLPDASFISRVPNATKVSDDNPLLVISKNKIAKRPAAFSSVLLYVAFKDCATNIFVTVICHGFLLLSLMTNEFAIESGVGVR